MFTFRYEDTLDDRVEGSGKGRSITLKKNIDHLEDAGLRVTIMGDVMMRVLRRLAVPALTIPRPLKCGFVHDARSSVTSFE